MTDEEKKLAEEEEKRKAAEDKIKLDEKKIEELYNFAEKIERKNRPETRKQILERSEKKRSEILEELKKKWGFE
jgi:hypothetical protein